MRCASTFAGCVCALFLSINFHIIFVGFFFSVAVSFCSAFCALPM